MSFSTKTHTSLKHDFCSSWLTPPQAGGSRPDLTFWAWIKGVLALTHWQKASASCPKRHEKPFNMWSYVTGRACSPSLDMPTSRHFLKRHCWHRFLLMRMMGQFSFLRHFLYWMFCWILRRKKPWLKAKQKRQDVSKRASERVRRSSDETTTKNSEQ